MEMNKLLKNVMRGRWQDVVEAYAKNPMASEAKINKSGDTALHIAVADGRTDIVFKLVETMGGNASNALKVKNGRGNTALHLAATIGNVDMCYCMATKAPELLNARNIEGETPLFVAVLRGHKEALSCLHFLSQETNTNSLSCTNYIGDSILHTAISGEYLNLAYQIICYHPHLVNSVNEKGQSPLHILASKPNAFKSSSCLGLIDHIIYNCIPVDNELRKGKQIHEAYVSNNFGAKTSINHAKNYGSTFMNFFQLIRNSIKVLCKKQPGESADVENCQHNKSQEDISLSTKKENSKSCTIFVLLFKLITRALLIILRLVCQHFGIWRITVIKEKKVKHRWANIVMDELVQRTSLYQYKDHNRQTMNILMVVKTQQSCQKETPLLIAAKNGVIEMVEKILDTFPVAMDDVNCENKNVVLLAVENRQTQLYKTLLERKTLMASAFEQLDNQGNNALHLAAMFGNCHPSSLIPGAALQMQWEIKWYKFVKTSMALNISARCNNEGKTPEEIFKETHKHLLKDGSIWLAKTSEYCSMIAALIAAIAFSTSVTVPGGFDEEMGKPILQDHFAFNIFAISALVAVCFSVTALLIFLAILTSRFLEKDFEKDLPRNLLMGLTSVFISIVSVLISFCSGNFLVIKDKLKSSAYPLYAVTCFPMIYFVLAKFPLFFDLMCANFRTVPQRSYPLF